MVNNESSESDLVTGQISEKKPELVNKTKPRFGISRIVVILLIIFLISTAVYFLIPKSKTNKTTSKPQPVALKSTVEKGNDAKVPTIFDQNKKFIYPNSEVTQVTSGDTTTTLALSSKDTFDDVKKYYEKLFKDEEWRVDGTKDKKDSYNVSVLKGAINFGITIVHTYNYQEVKKDSPARIVTDGPTLITIGVAAR